MPGLIKRLVPPVAADVVAVEEEVQPIMELTRDLRLPNCRGRLRRCKLAAKQPTSLPLRVARQMHSRLQPVVEGDGVEEDPEVATIQVGIMGAPTTLL
jgi:hypothetical protein